MEYEVQRVTKVVTCEVAEITADSKEQAEQIARTSAWAKWEAVSGRTKIKLFIKEHFRNQSNETRSAC